MLNPLRLARRLKPTPLEDRTTNELPGWLLKLFGSPEDPPKNQSLDAWETFTRPR